MKIKTLHTDQAPAAIGPYSQAIISNGFLYSAGQIALDPKSGEFLRGDVQSEARRVFENLKAVLGEAGLTFSDVVKTTVYLVSMDDFPALNQIYAEYFGMGKPARSTVAVAQLPKGARVEIDLIAAL